MVSGPVRAVALALVAALGSACGALHGGTPIVTTPSAPVVAPAHERASIAPLLTWLALAQAGDIATTMYALNHGCHEGNPVAAPNMARTYAAKTGMTIGFSIGVTLTRDKPQGRAWRIAAMMPAALGTAATAWNVRQIARGCQ